MYLKNNTSLSRLGNGPRRNERGTARRTREWFLRSCGGTAEFLAGIGCYY